MTVALFQHGDFPLTSGGRSAWRIECDALGDTEWAALAAMLMDYLPHGFYDVLGVPRGGVPFERALKPYALPEADRFLVVDDVWTTGGSMRRFVEAHGRDFGERSVMYAVAFARNPVPDGVTALFSMPVRPSLSADQPAPVDGLLGPDSTTPTRQGDRQ